MGECFARVCEEFVLGVLVLTSGSDRSYEQYCDLSRQYDPSPPARLPNGTPIPKYTGPGIDTFVAEFGRLDLLEYSTDLLSSSQRHNFD